jgi:hypothetical protein
MERQRFSVFGQLSQPCTNICRLTPDQLPAHRVYGLLTLERSLLRRRGELR